MRKHLSSLEAKFRKVKPEKRTASAEKERITKIGREFRAKFPNLHVRKELLALVGTEPLNPVKKDKEITRKIVAERYG